ncbi:MAG: twin-arginine translocation signal domain-containing protein, partial [bacterium]|nr:twin-arginine translocation signal domain-containing protein [bacterium]
MPFIRKKEWAIPEREATPESVFWERRKFLKGAAGLAAGGILGGALLDEAASAAD